MAPVVLFLPISPFSQSTWTLLNAKARGRGEICVNVLVRIKLALFAGRYAFSEKARLEMEIDQITELDVVESILNAVVIDKRLRSHSPLRPNRREYLYVIKSANFEGLEIYTKGKLVQETGVETYYFLVSSKRAL